MHVFQIFISLALIAWIQPMHAMEQSPRPADCLLVCHVKNNDAWAVQELLKAGANPNIEEFEGVPTLLKAIEQDNFTICQLLLEHGADPNIPIRNCFDSTLLNYAINSRNQPICQLLLEFGANPNAMDVLGNNPLARAIKVGYWKMCALFADHGAKLDAKNREGKNAFEQATELNSQNLIPILITHANFNPCISDRAFHRFLAAQSKIYTALMVFKQLCPLMPKDIRKLVLRSIPELQSDLQIMSNYGLLKNIHEEHATTLPHQLVGWLIERGKLNAERCVAHITERGCNQLIMILVQSNATTRSWFFNHFNLNQFNIYWPTQLSLISKFTPYFSRIFGPQIERTTRKRLGLLTWKNWMKDLASTSCSVQ